MPVLAISVGAWFVQTPLVALDGIGIPVSTLTPAGLLALVIILIAVGRLVPRRTLEDTIHDRDEWRTAHRISETARAELASQVSELLEHARTTESFIRAIPHAAAAIEMQRQQRTREEQNDDG